jgi:hypothetical protein
MRALVGLVVFVMASSGCNECSINDDCDLGDVCSVNVCAVPIALLSPTDVDDRFSVELEVRVPAGTSTISVRRSDVEPGEPCIAFPKQQVVVENNGADYEPAVVRFDNLSALGPSFSLTFQINRAAELTTAFTGPAISDDIGGIDVTLSVDISEPIDVGRDPTAIVTLTTPVTNATIVVVPENNTALPLQAMTVDGELRRAEVMLVRGTQTIEVRAELDGAQKVCALAVEGTTDDGRGNTADLLEFLLVTQTIDDTVGAAELSTRRTTTTSQEIVGGGISGQLVSRAIDTVNLATGTGVIDVAVVPVVASSPLNAMVRVSHRGQHLGVFGPMTIQPASGECWLAGMVVINDDNSATAIASTTAPQLGAPW